MFEMHSRVTEFFISEFCRRQFMYAALKLYVKLGKFSWSLKTESRRDIDVIIDTNPARHGKHRHISAKITMNNKYIFCRANSDPLRSTTWAPLTISLIYHIHE